MRYGAEGEFAGEAIVNKHVEAIGIMPHLHATA